MHVGDLGTCGRSSERELTTTSCCSNLRTAYPSFQAVVFAAFICCFSTASSS